MEDPRKPGEIHVLLRAGQMRTQGETPQQFIERFGVREFLLVCPERESRSIATEDFAVVQRRNWRKRQTREGFTDTFTYAEGLR